MTSIRATASFVTALCLSLSTCAAEHLRHGDPHQRGLQFDGLPNEFCWVPFTNCRADQCATVSPLGVDEFDLDLYVEKSWFVQKQQVNPYQSEEDLYCVVATYNKRDDGYIQVDNSGRKGGVNGAVQGAEEDSLFSELCARQVEGGSLRVAPCLFRFAFNAVAGPYWVVAADTTNYTWAIISGGAPDEPRETVNGRTFCTTKEGSSFLDTNGSGLWLFTKERVATPEKIAMMESKMAELGMYAGDLKPVAQENCSYPEFIKE